MQLNPMTPIIDGYRAVLLHGQSPFTAAVRGSRWSSRWCSSWSRWLTFHRAEFQFAENI